MSLLKKIQGAKYKKQNKLFFSKNRLFYVSNTLEKIGSTNKMFVILQKKNQVWIAVSLQILKIIFSSQSTPTHFFSYTIWYRRTFARRSEWYVSFIVHQLLYRFVIFKNLILFFRFSPQSLAINVLKALNFKKQQWVARLVVPVYLNRVPAKEVQPSIIHLFHCS